MTDLNLVVLSGRLVKTPDLIVKGELKFLNFTIAVNHSFKDKATDNWVEKTSFVGMTVFGQKAESLQKRLEKGKMIQVQGRIYQNVWETENGKKNSELKVVPEKVFVLPDTRKQAENKTEELEMGSEVEISQSTITPELVNNGNEFDIF